MTPGRAPDFLCEALRRAGLPASPASPRGGDLLRATQFTVLDLETTGLDARRDCILAVGAVRMNGDRIPVSETFYRLVRPDRAAWPGTVPLHRILPGDVAAAPEFAEILPELLAFCRETVLVGHGVYLDRAFLERAGKAGRRQWRRSRWVDTGRAARWLASRSPARESSPPADTPLGAAAARYGIPVSVRHHALADAFVAALIWQRQIHELQAAGISRVGEVLRIANARPPTAQLWRPFGC